MKIVCKNMKREELAVDLDPSENLESLLRKLKEVHGVDSENSSLIFSGAVLADLAKTIQSLNYKEGDWFVLFPRKLRTSVPTPVSTPIAEIPVPPSVSAGNPSTARARGARVPGPRALPPRMPARSQTQTVRISEEAILSLMSILQSDPNCSRVLRENPALIARIRDPTVLVNLANMVGLDLTRFIRRDTDTVPEEEKEPQISDSIWSAPNPSQTVRPLEIRVRELSTDRQQQETAVAEEVQRRQILRLPEAEVKLLKKIKDDLMGILGELPENVNEYQVNTMVYECYLAADKNPDVALNILIDHLLDQGD